MEDKLPSFGFDLLTEAPQPQILADALLVFGDRFPAVGIRFDGSSLRTQLGTDEKKNFVIDLGAAVLGNDHAA